MKIAKNLLEIAKKDLKASKCLYDNGLYPQAVFYLQQSVEKATKTFGILSDFIDENELKDFVGHNPLKIHKKVFEEQKRIAENLNRIIGDISDTDKRKMKRIFDFEKYDNRRLTGWN